MNAVRYDQLRLALVRAVAAAPWHRVARLLARRCHP